MPATWPHLPQLPAATSSKPGKQLSRVDSPGDDSASIEDRDDFVTVVRVHGHEVRADIDTKAAINCISKHVVHQLKLTPKNQVKHLVMANGVTHVADQCVSIKFVLPGGQQYEDVFWILPTTTWDLIIGRPALRKLPAKFMFNGKTIFQGQNSFEAVKSKPLMQLW